MLALAFEIAPGNCVGIVGAGGKTTLAYTLIKAAAARGERAVFTTTTRVWRPADGAFDALIPSHDLSGLGEPGWRSAAIVAQDGPLNLTPVPGATMPTVQTKVGGLPPDAICALHHNYPAVTFIVEADGARGLRLKAPGPTEPQLPACADVVCVVACMDAIGRALDDRIAFRVDRVAALTGVMPGSVITPTLIATLLSHPDGGLKGVPTTARRIAVLTQNGGALHPDAPGLRAALLDAGFDAVVVIGARDAAGDHT
jgi:molybdenum cofactor cytidylyltransferase